MRSVILIALAELREPEGVKLVRVVVDVRIVVQRLGREGDDASRGQDCPIRNDSFPQSHPRGADC